MLSSGFAGAPVTKYGVLFLIASSILVSVADVKHMMYIQVVPHLWEYWQVWRMVVWPICYINSGEVLFAAMLLYQLRVIERLWGSRKFASFLLTTTPYTTLLPPLLLTLLLRPLSLHTLNYLPPGPTATLFAILAQFYSAIPYQYKYRLSTSTTTTTPPNNPPTDPSITLTDKSLTYLLATQLALAQFPHSLVPAAVGWAVGYAWRSDVLPGRAAGWRVPGWVYGGKERGGEEGGDGSSENGYRRVAGGWGEGGGEGVGAGAGVGDGDAGQFEGLRRRLETGRGDGGGVGAAAGQQGRGPGQQGRTLFGQVVDRFRGGF